MSNTSKSLDPPLAQLRPNKLSDHSLYNFIFKQNSCNLPQNLAVDLVFHATEASGPTPGQTTTGVARVIPEQSDTEINQSITVESPLVHTSQQQNIIHPSVSLQDSPSDIAAAKMLTVKTTQSPPSRIPIPSGSTSLDGHTDAAAGTVGEAVSRIRTSPHEIYLQVLIVSLNIEDVPVRETQQAPEPAKFSSTPAQNREQFAAPGIDHDRNEPRTNRERIYGVGITVAVCEPTTQSARRARRSPEEAADHVLATFGTERDETGFLSVSCDPSKFREQLSEPDTRPFGTRFWNLMQASRIAPTVWLKRDFLGSGRPGMPRVCESDLSLFIGEEPTDTTYTGLGPGTR